MYFLCDFFKGDYEFILLFVVDGDMLIFGLFIGDNWLVVNVLGVVCVFDVCIGVLCWYWDLVECIVEVGNLDVEFYFIWDGVVNVWGVFLVDVVWYLIFIFIGLVSLDLYGGECFGDNYWVNLLVVLDIVIGKLVWVC